MKSEVTSTNGESVVKVTGCLDTAAVTDFKSALDALPPETKRVTFDFAALDFIASSALRVMVTLGKRLNEKGGGITVSGANELVRDVFEMTGLVEAFTVL